MYFHFIQVKLTFFLDQLGIIAYVFFKVFIYTYINIYVLTAVDLICLHAQHNLGLKSKKISQIIVN